MEGIYDHIYLKLEKDRIKKELLEKENKEKEGINKIKKFWMKFLHWIINSILTRRVGNHSEDRDQLFYTSLNG
jgi:hypothetical protein